MKQIVKEIRKPIKSNTEGEDPDKLVEIDETHFQSFANYDDLPELVALSGSSQEVFLKRAIEDMKYLGLPKNDSSS
jgi:hypothetical protein